MYHLLLTRRYLTTKILPFLATLAVLLSTATVIIAWSIMTGFLGVLLNSGRNLVGDIIISWPAGFGYYEELITDLEKEPTIKAATPMIETYGLVKLPDNRIVFVSIKGIDSESYNRVTGFADSVWWKPMDEPMPKDVNGDDPRLVRIAPFVAELGALADSLSTAAIAVSAQAKQRGAPEEVVNALADIPQRLQTLVKQGRDAVAMPANTNPRRDATAAFLREAGSVFDDAFRAMQSLVVAQTFKPDELQSANPGAASENAEKNILLGNLLFRYDRVLSPIYHKYMHYYDAFVNGASITVQDPKTGERVPAMVIGIEATNYNQRHPEGFYTPKVGVQMRTSSGHKLINSNVLEQSLTLNLLPLDFTPTRFDLVARPIPVANEFRSGLFQFDKNWMMINLNVLQGLVRMDAAEEVEDIDPYAVVEGPDGQTIAKPQVTRRTPARVTHILVRGVDGANLDALQRRCQEIYASFSSRHPLDTPDNGLINISTFEQEQGMLVAAVKKEIVMVLLILGVVSLTVSFLILAIFWAIVREKTKDIGILRAIGASRLSVCGLWLEYALITGLLGSVLGGLAGCLVVWNINPIHDWLGAHLGLVIWDPRIYYFFEIPNQVDPGRVVLVMVAGVCFSVLGAMIPAVRAAYMDPVKSLRFE